MNSHLYLQDAVAACGDRDHSARHGDREGAFSVSLLLITLVVILVWFPLSEQFEAELLYRLTLLEEKGQVCRQTGVDLWLNIRTKPTLLRALGIGQKLSLQASACIERC